MTHVHPTHRVGDGGKPPGGGAGGGNPLAGLMDALGKALGAAKPPPSAPAQACSTDPNMYAQQQQQYQQALQQYNYQLQQYNYQIQLNQYYGGTAPTPPQPVQPTPCTPSTGNQCQSQPQQPSPASCSVGSWRATYSGACVIGWECVPSTATSTLKAQLSCEPKVADVGTTLAITYSCSSGTATSTSFAVTSQPSGSAPTTVANPPAGTNTATYTLTCTDGEKTSGAQCSVQVSKPSIILVANPKTVTSGSNSLIGWITTGMKSCIISSPDQVDFTARNSSNTSTSGAASTSPITSATTFALNCETIGGGSRQATTSVTVAP